MVTCKCSPKSIHQNAQKGIEQICNRKEITCFGCKKYILHSKNLHAHFVLRAPPGFEIKQYFRQVGVLKLHLSVAVNSIRILVHSIRKSTQNEGAIVDRQDLRTAADDLSKDYTGLLMVS